MLTGDLALSYRRGNMVAPKHIETGDAKYLRVADDLVAIFRDHQGRPRAELDEELDQYVGAGTDYKILRGFIKLLSDRSTFETSVPVEPAELRRALFMKARLYHPATGEARDEVISQVAAEMGCAIDDVTAHLYGDLPENQKLVAFDDLGAKELIDRYNLAQAQALLYRSVEMRVRVEPQEAASYRQLFDAIKYYRLIHTIRGSQSSGYEVRLSGPVSIFHRSQKYGVQMAVFLPALLACRNWSLRAEIDMKGRGPAFFELASDQRKLRSTYESEPRYENPFVEKLASRWEDGASAWRMERSREVIDLAGSVFIPDFVFIHESGRRLFLEVLGFWTPKYLADRLKQFEHARMTNFLLAASEDLLGSRDSPAHLPANVIVFKSALGPKEIRAALESVTSDE
jgi:predicted nuclease of restriction endonuclease-like RecB superfamily